MAQFVALPVDLAEVPAGPSLCAALATIDPATLNGWQLVEVLEARNRQLSYEQAQLLRAVRELAYTTTAGTDSAPERNLRQDPYAGPEIAFALACSDYAAQTLVETALAAVDTMPAVYDALADGRLDWTKTKLICTELSQVDPAQLDPILGRLLPEVTRCTPSQLRQRLRRLVLRVDPAAAKERHAKAVADRHVMHWEYANGTGSLCASYLSKDKAAAAWSHIDALAQATKQSGDQTRELDQIRADVFADLLAGVDPVRAGTAASPGPRRPGITVHLDLATLACLDDLPGELDGFGPVLADVARQTALQLAEVASWRFAVRDEYGDTVAEGPLRRPNLQTLAGLITAPDPAGATKRPGSPGPGPSGDTPTAAGAVGVNRTGYRPTTAQKAFVRTRDRTCRAPGCQRPARACDLDHIDDWATSYTTSATNLCCLCRRHHRAKHVAGYRIRRSIHGIEWLTPRGRHYTVLAEHARVPHPLEQVLTQLAHGYHTPGTLRR